MTRIWCLTLQRLLPSMETILHGPSAFTPIPICKAHAHAFASDSDYDNAHAHVKVQAYAHDLAIDF